MSDRIRSGRTHGYTVLTNTVLKDKRLRLQTKGLFAIMTSFPEGWSYSVAGLCTVTGAGKAAVKSCLDELQEAGYLRRSQEHRQDGTFGTAVYILYDEPPDLPLTENQSTVENTRDLPLADHPSTDKPPTGEPPADDQPQYNKQVLNKHKSPYSPPEDGGDGLDLFDRFWAAYPKKVGKQAARKAWKKLKLDRRTMQVMSDALSLHKASWKWAKEGGAYIPDPATWLNGRRWEDDPTAYPPAGAVERQKAPPAPERPHVPVYVRTEIDPITGAERDIYE